MGGFPHWDAGEVGETVDTMQSTSDPKLGGVCPFGGLAIPPREQVLSKLMAGHAHQRTR